MKKYRCPECLGSGEVECGECGHMKECDCRGTGYDPHKVNMDKWIPAEKAFQKLATKNRRATWALLNSDGLEIGRAAFAGTKIGDRNPQLSVEDFICD